MLLRARVSAFLSGVAIAGVFAVYQLRKDVTDSHKILADQVSITPVLGVISADTVLLSAVTCSNSLPFPNWLMKEPTPLLTSIGCQPFSQPESLDHKPAQLARVFCPFC